MCSFLSFAGEVDEEEGEVEEELVGDIWVMADIAVRLELIPDRLCMWLGIWYMADMLCTPLNMLEPGNTVMLFGSTHSIVPQLQERMGSSVLWVETVE